jgi:RNase P/RNase MRP subunit POP5
MSPKWAKHLLKNKLQELAATPDGLDTISQYLTTQDARKKELIMQLQTALRASMSQTDQMRKSLQSMPSPSNLKEMLMQNPSLFYNPDELREEISDACQEMFGEYSALSAGKIEAAISGPLSGGVLEVQKAEKQFQKSLLALKTALIRSRAASLVVPVLSGKVKEKKDKLELKKKQKKEAGIFKMNQEFEAAQEQAKYAAGQKKLLENAMANLIDDDSMDDGDAGSFPGLQNANANQSQLPGPNNNNNNANPSSGSNLALPYSGSKMGTRSKKSVSTELQVLHVLVMNASSETPIDPVQMRALQAMARPKAEDKRVQRVVENNDVQDAKKE